MKMFQVYKWDCIIRWGLFGVVALLAFLSSDAVNLISNPTTGIIDDRYFRHLLRGSSRLLGNRKQGVKISLLLHQFFKTAGFGDATVFQG